ncbi:hypothetical protein ACS0TY_027728 [Phlomoides rotata]
MLLNSLPKSLDSFKDTLLFGRSSGISFDEIQVALKTKCLNTQTQEMRQTEDLNVKFKKGKNKNQRKKGFERANNPD